MISRKNNRRHLADSVSTEGRRLRSAFDVFDFVNNAVSSGVDKAKKNTDKVLKSLKKQLEPAAKDLRGVEEDVKKLVNRGEKVIKDQIAENANLEAVDKIA